MTTTEQLKAFFEQLCKTFPNAYCRLTLEVNRHTPWSTSQPGEMTATYTLYVADLLHVEAPTVPDLIERAKVSVKDVLGKPTADVMDVLNGIVSW